ncbi:MAG: sulfur oxidation c-type cytochrome SoxX [Rhizobiales bacterium 32-66-11]|nr:MAG: sulfur oxidation c-type cytochrome SoxX [Rhizobiales bacterium 32-66-11]
MAAGLAIFAAPPLYAQEAPLAYAVAGDAIERPLAGQAGDAARGAALMGDRHKSLCVLCHSGPFGPVQLQGTLAPDLTGIGDRLSPGQIRLRIVDMKALQPESLMPAYYRIADAPRVAAAWREKPLLTAGEIEDLVAYLSTLKE